jgi:hypothetical protein
MPLGCKFGNWLTSTPLCNGAPIIPTCRTWTKTTGPLVLSAFSSHSTLQTNRALRLPPLRPAWSLEL